MSQHEWNRIQNGREICPGCNGSGKYFQKNPVPNLTSRGWGIPPWEVCHTCWGNGYTRYVPDPFRARWETVVPDNPSKPQSYDAERESEVPRQEPSQHSNTSQSTPRREEYTREQPKQEPAYTQRQSAYSQSARSEVTGQRSQQKTYAGKSVSSKRKETSGCVVVFVVALGIAIISICCIPALKEYHFESPVFVWSPLGIPIYIGMAIVLVGLWLGIDQITSKEERVTWYVFIYPVLIAISVILSISEYARLLWIPVITVLCLLAALAFWVYISYIKEDPQSRGGQGGGNR